jgi:hypothetical protein
MPTSARCIFEGGGIEMARRTYRDIFLDELEELPDGGKKWVGNISLREALGWETDRYNSIKRQLLDEDIIVVARGKGGSVGLADANEAGPTNVFVSYAHEDASLERELVKHLEPLRRQEIIDVWHDRELKGGDEWDKEISKTLEKADIILLLISVDFMNSVYCYENELEIALERHAAGTARVIPIILRDCMWKQSLFSNLQALPENGKAISTFPNIDTALSSVAESVRDVVVRMREEEE